MVLSFAWGSRWLQERLDVVGTESERACRRWERLEVAEPDVAVDGGARTPQGTPPRLPSTILDLVHELPFARNRGDTPAMYG